MGKKETTKTTKEKKGYTLKVFTLIHLTQVMVLGVYQYTVSNEPNIMSNHLSITDFPLKNWIKQETSVP